jgi:hypothetical protein
VEISQIKKPGEATDFLHKAWEGHISKKLTGNARLALRLKLPIATSVCVGFKS